MKTHLISIIALVLLTGFLSAQDNKASISLTAAIYEDEVTGNLEGAIKTYQMIVEQYPDNRQVAAKALLHLGACYEKMGLKQAHKTYQEIINRYPEQKDEVSAAKERVNYLEAIAANLSNKAKQHLKKGNELFNQWEYEPAIEEFKNVINLDSTTLLAQNAKYNIGMSWFKAGRYDEALSVFTNLIDEYPESTIAPVSELMLAQVKHAIENSNQQLIPDMDVDENTIIDSETGITYEKVKTFTGKNDWISYTSGGFNMLPDGRFMVLENKVVPTDGSDPFTLVDMEMLRGVYSPDIKKAAFYADSAIWIVPVSPETGHANGPPEKLLEGSYLYQHIVSWSPDGEKIAFSRRDETVTDDIWILSVSDGTLMPVTNLLGRESTPAWSPDGNSIAYENDGIWLASVPAKENKLIIKSGGNPHWSPDSKWLHTSNNGDSHFYSLDSENNYEFKFPKQVGTFGTFSSKGDKMLFYKSSYDAKWGLKVVSILGGPSYKPAPSDEVYGYQWSADSKLILAQGENANNDIGYKIVPFAGGSPVEVKIKVNDKPFPFRYSPDLTKLAFSIEREDDKEDLYIVPFSMEEASTTGPARLVFEGWSGGAYNITFSWSHDGTKLALIHEGDIWIVPLEGGSPLQITNTPEGERWVNWSPDGKKISFVTRSKQTGILHIITTDDKVSKVVNNNCRGSKWSPDSENLVVISSNKLLIIGLDGEKAEDFELAKEIGFGNASDLSFSPDGKYFAFIGHKDEESIIYVYSLETKEITYLGDDCLNDYKYGLNWSPNGKWLSYLTYEEEKVRPEGSLWEADFEEIKEKLLQQQ